MESMSERLVGRLLLLLAAAAGCLDALCVARLGGPFASVITGNLVQLGSSIGTWNGRLAAASGIAIAGYAVGVAVGAAGLRHTEPGWRSRTGRVLAVELVLLAGMAGGWVATGGRPGHADRMVLLAVAAAAMGVQSAVTLTSGVGQASTTYLTGTLTSLIRDLVNEPRRYVSTLAGAFRLAALLCGAAAGGVLLHFAPLWTPVVSVTLVATVLAIAGWSATEPLRPSVSR
jgi:uncharacterized membrane protein YoaK (UPF0700 family)